MFLLFDIGGTKMRIGYSADGKTLGDCSIFDTPQAYEDGINIIKNYLSSEGFKPWKVCGGLPGIINKNDELIFAPNLKKWLGKPIKNEIEKVTDCPVILKNDASLAGLGEATFGSAINYPIVAYITISTGIGGARIVNKKIDISSWGFEPGHQIIDISQTQDSVADWEVLVSGSGIMGRYKVAPENLSDKKIWKKIVGEIAIGLVNVIMFWSPDIIVLGGGLLDSEFVSMDGLNDSLHKYLENFPQKPPIIRYTLGEKAGLYGALAYLKSTL